ncbi:Cytochrome c peroxidase, mitochondrial [Hondaea fermentalgiana]|uniref:Cytochrome c peroxidase, mitochondrial n=1 Tax=Hondaea fermentalgiana TaxID=2315210 RepID=A0A2R5FZB9_9STRA|nr:Cytochrome c peroxidase, mitochondrial [Hondaea fermentalgiana]|eukprot:GBG24070.1 Cytochrome c peroxidase, mitochondrial [Hondaea fermentalgiana]
MLSHVSRSLRVRAAPNARQISAVPLAVAAAAIGGGGYYYYTTQQEAAPVAPKVDYKKVAEDVADALDDESHDDGSFGPTLVRLGWHSSGTYDKNSNDGGSDGSGMRFAPESKWGANAGLHKARAVMEKIKSKHPEITYSDLWILAATAAIEEMGGPHIPFRAGRTDKTENKCTPLPDGRLPDADGRDHKDAPADHLRDIFYRMGFNDQEIVALAGAHALGRCHTENSGYWGPWTNAPTTFSNEYFRLLLEEKWTPKKKHEGKAWTGPFQYEDPSGKLMMLPTDIALIQDKAMRPFVEKYAKDEEAFFQDFAKAWVKLTENGCKNLTAEPVW